MSKADNFTLEVNDKVIEFHDPVLTVDQILSASGFRPADEHILIRLMPGSANALGLDESIDLREGGSTKFRAFKSGRIFRFTLNGGGFEWGKGYISEPELRELAEVQNDEVLILERRDEPDREIDRSDQVVLTDAGTEHIRTTKKLITVTINGGEKQIARGSYTTEQLNNVLVVESGYLLNVLAADGQLKTLNAGEQVCVREGMKFVSQVPSGGSS